jgi:hypothetical protein
MASPLKNDTPMEKTAEMLDEDRYWAMIQQAQDSTEDLDEMEEQLIEEVEKLTPKEMVGFYLRTHYLTYKAYTSELWCAGYIVNGGCSDDGFEYFRLWLISAGKEIYYKALANPDSLVEVVEANNDTYDFEALTYVPLTAFSNKTGLDLYDYVDDENFKYRGETEMEFTWEEEDVESQQKICPKLYAMFAED